MTEVYRSGLMVDPPLAWGGHMWHLDGQVARCWRCYAPVPRWSLSEGLWMTFAARWCTALAAALPAGPDRPPDAG